MTNCLILDPELIEPPAEELVILSQTLFKKHVRVEEDATYEDDLLDLYLKAALSHCERILNARLLSSKWRYTLPHFPRYIHLPHWPLASVDAVKYLDTAGVEQTLTPNSHYVARLQRREIALPPGDITTYWPDVQSYNPGAVSVEVTLGYQDPERIPPEIRIAIAMLAAHFYANRESVAVGAGGLTSVEVPQSVDRLLAPHREIYF